MELSQFQVAHGEKFCKAGCQIKNADHVTTDRPGLGNRQVGDFSQTSKLACANGGRFLASHWRRWPMTGLDYRQSMLSRRAMGLRRPLRIFAGLLLWLLSAPLIITARAQTTNDAVALANTLWPVPGIRMNDVMRSSDGKIFVLTQVAEKRDVTVFEEAIAALKRRDCKGAWDMVWPLAKAGDQSARHFLYAQVVGQMRLPGVTRDHAMHFRHYLTIAAYAAITPDKQLTFRGDTGRRAVRHDIISSLRSMKLGQEGERVAQCYTTTKSFKKCLDLAVSLGVISSFEDYARDTEKAERETGVAAQCLPPLF